MNKYGYLPTLIDKGIENIVYNISEIVPTTTGCCNGHNKKRPTVNLYYKDGKESLSMKLAPLGITAKNIELLKKASNFYPADLYRIDISEVDNNKYKKAEIIKEYEHNVLIELRRKMNKYQHNLYNLTKRLGILCSIEQAQPMSSDNIWVLCYAGKEEKSVEKLQHLLQLNYQKGDVFDLYQREIKIDNFIKACWVTKDATI